MPQESKQAFRAALRRKGVTDATEVNRRWAQHVQAESGGRARVTGRGDYNTRIPLRNVQGRGAYNYRKIAGDAGRLIPKGTFARGGRALGSLISPLGGELGTLAGRGLSLLTGMGDYTVAHNSVMKGGGSGADSSFETTGSSRIRLKRRECIGVINAPATPAEFATTRIRVQASDEECFPWGHHVAELYQEYQLYGAVFTFESTFSNYSSAGPLGSVVIATQYNAADRPFPDIESMLNSAYRTAGNPSQSLVHGLECDPKLQSNEQLLVRSNSNSHSTGAPNNYDFGFVTVATQGLPAGSADGQIGRLYVTYDLELTLPKVPDTITQIADNQQGLFGMMKNVVVPFNPLSIFHHWNGGAIATAGTYGPLVGFADSELSIGDIVTESNIVQFPATANGDNVPWFQPPNLENNDQLVWLCGSPYDSGSPSTFQTHINFRYGGSVRVTFTLYSAYTVGSVLPAGTPNAYHVDDEIPPFVIQGDHSHSVSSTLNYPLTPIVSPATLTVDGVDITFIIHFNPEAPSRVLTLLPNKNGFNYQVGTQGNTTRPPSVAIQFLGN